jgi:RNA polymerase sigma factor (sigma-70 family)
MDKYLKTAEAVAKSYAARWHFYSGKVVDWEDIFSELKVWIYSNIDWIEKIEEELETVNAERKLFDKEPISDGRIFTAMRNVVNSFAATEMKHLQRKELNSSHYYSPEALKRSLNIFFEIDFADLEMRSDSSDLSYAIAADINSAYWGISEYDRKYIDLRFKEDLSFLTIGEQLGISENTATKRVHRAIKRMSDLMGEEPLHWSNNVKPKPPADYY